MLILNDHMYWQEGMWQIKLARVCCGIGIIFVFPLIDDTVVIIKNYTREVENCMIINELHDNRI